MLERSRIFPYRKIKWLSYFKTERCSAIIRSSHTTFAERFKFLRNKAKKSLRLEDQIVQISLNCSLVAASEILSKNVVDVGKSTVCNILKKRRTCNQ